MTERTSDLPRRWVISGASRGLGHAIAVRALQGGDQVALLARDPAIGEIAERLGADCLGFPADVTEPESLATACGRIAERWGGIDVLINNAGLHRGGLIDKIEQKDWQDVLNTNLTGPFLAVRAALPWMGEGASIVNIGAVVGLRGFAGDGPYGASKAGLTGLTQILAVELARRKIRVNMVIPGFVTTEMTSHIPPKARERLMQKIPLGREGLAEEIAEVVWWVAGSRYMTGAIVPTDGGLMAQL
jgi:NAD(P)-dependent dehydrogenase (short-subunit alcohol dehydrogenase family)